MALNRALLILLISCLILLSGNAHEEEVDEKQVDASSPSSSFSVRHQRDEQYPSEEESKQTYQVEPVEVLLSGRAAATAHIEPTQVEIQATMKKIEKNMMVTMEKTEDILKVIKKRLSATPGESRSEDCLKTCIEVYELAIDGMKNSIEDLESKNFYKVNVDISAVSTDVETCEECYIEMLGEDPELKKFDEWVRGVTSECLGDLETVST